MSLFKFAVLAFALAAPATLDPCKPQPIEASILAELKSRQTASGGSCPAQLNVGQFCNAVSDQLGNTTGRFSGRFYQFQYQQLIRDAACVDPDDAPEVVAGKIQHLWNQQHARLVCNQLGFSVRDGYLLKLAVESDSREFVNDAVRRWKLDLNHVDATGQTVLDYIESERARHAGQGSSYESILQRYFKIFRDHGAKFRRELPSGTS